MNAALTSKLVRFPTSPLLFMGDKLGYDESQARAKELGRWLKTRRLEIGLNRPEMAEEVRRRVGEFTADYLAKIEGGSRPLYKASVEIREAMRGTFRMSVDAWREETGLFVPEPKHNLMRRAEDREARATVAIPQFASLAEGIRKTLEHTPPDDYLLFDRKQLGSVRGDRLLVTMRVNGDSLYAVNLTNPIPAGSSVIVELGATPEAGEVVVAWIDELGVSVLKEFRAEGGAPVMLRSYQAGGLSFFDSEYPNMEVVAVVRAIITLS